MPAYIHMRLVLISLILFPAWTLADPLTAEEMVAIATTGKTDLSPEAFAAMVTFVKKSRPLLSESEAREVVRIGDYRTPTPREMRAATKDGASSASESPASPPPISQVDPHQQPSSPAPDGRSERWSNMSVPPTTEEILQGARRTTGASLDAAFGKAIPRDQAQETVASPDPYKGFAVIATAEVHCAIPKGALMHLPEALKIYVVDKPQGKYLPFEAFIKSTGSLIRAWPLEKDSKGDPRPVLERVLQEMKTSDQIVISTLDGSPFPFESD